MYELCNLDNGQYLISRKINFLVGKITEIHPVVYLKSFFFSISMENMHRSKTCLSCATDPVVDGMPRRRQRFGCIGNG